MISTAEKISHLEEFTTNDWFILDAWEDRELTWPGDDVVEQMRLEVQDFTNFLILYLKKDNIDLQIETQNYFTGWDTEYFENEEIEFIVEINLLAMRIAGINIDEIII